MKIKKVIWVLIATLCLTNFSCKKDGEYVCSNGCVDLSINGRVIDKTTNQPIPNVVIKANWEGVRDCYTCPLPKVNATVQSDANGNFSIPVSINKPLEYWDAIQVVSESINGYFDNYTIQYNPTRGSGFVTIIRYQKTKLKINLHRIFNFNYESVGVFRRFDESEIVSFYNDFNRLSPLTFSDTSIIVETPASIKTWVVTSKQGVNGINSGSEGVIIIPSANTVNEINFNY
jgi:hypothetical protein